ncbi:hypothetical protein BD769DRAFT_1683284 [Suillus cothurnatus]|nr:hypothetical protein BD769DRAFT_1683284 [Suillus cothurnatus]
MSTAIVKYTLSTLSKSTAVNCNYTYNTNSLMKSKTKTHEILAAEDAFAVGSSIQNSPPSAQKCKHLSTLFPPDHLHHLLDSFNWFSWDNPELSPAAVHVGQEVLCFIAKSDHQHECEEFSGVWCEEFETLVQFIEDNPNFGLKPRQHPDSRNAICEVLVPIIGETVFSQHTGALMDKFQEALDADPSIIMAIMAVVTESKHYSSPVKGSPSQMALMHDGLICSAKDFITGSNVLPTLNAPVIVEGHMWCSVELVTFKVWVRGDEIIDLETHDPAFMAEGTLCPVDNMDSVVDMIQKRVDMLRGQIILMSLAIDANINVVALQDPTIKFHIRKGDIITKITGTMHETAYRCYLVWYKKASKAFKQKATFKQLPPMIGPPATNTHAKMKVKHHMGASCGGVRLSCCKGT